MKFMYSKLGLRGYPELPNIEEEQKASESSSEEGEREQKYSQKELDESVKRAEKETAEGSRIITGLTCAIVLLLLIVLIPFCCIAGFFILSF
jgi:hypothetical protein